MVLKLYKYIRHVRSFFDLSTWRAWRAAQLGRKFDQEHGTNTQGYIGVEQLEISREAAAHAVHYEPSTLPKLRRALNRLNIRQQEYSFIDVGSGKGLVVIEAAKQSFNTVIGLEISPPLHNVALNNVKAASSIKNLSVPIKLYNIDALGYDYPAVKQVVYLYNPFDESILRQLLRKLTDRLTSGTEDILIAYVNPVYKTLIEKEFAVQVIYIHRTLMIYRLLPHNTSTSPDILKAN